MWVNRFLTTEEQGVYTAFGENVNNELYIANIVEGEIYHVVDSAALPLKTASDKTSTPLQNDKISLFPNPNSGLFKVQVSAARDENYIVSISNQLGQQMLIEKKSVHAGWNDWTFSSENFTKGIYIFQVRTSDGIINKKFSVQ